jgi:hypothetical protein
MGNIDKKHKLLKENYKIMQIKGLMEGLSNSGKKKIITQLNETVWGDKDMERAGYASSPEIVKKDIEKNRSDFSNDLSNISDNIFDMSNKQLSKRIMDSIGDSEKIGKLLYIMTEMYSPEQVSAFFNKNPKIKNAVFREDIIEDIKDNYLQLVATEGVSPEDATNMFNTIIG